MGRRLSILAGVLFGVLSGVRLEAEVMVIDTIWFGPRAGNGIEPRGVSVNPNTNKIYIVNESTNNVSVIDGVTDSVEQTVYVPGNPLFIGVNDSNSRFYATCPQEGVVVVLLDGAGVEESAKCKLQNVKLEIHPNPFAHKIAISYTIPANNEVSLKIYDLAGRLVKTLVNEKKKAGEYSIEWNAKNHQRSGIYFLRFTSGDCRETRKLIVVK